jgi:hypothetical protein
MAMAQDANYLRELLSLARMLRRFALEQGHDNHHVLFISTAMALEARAHDLAPDRNRLPPTWSATSFSTPRSIAWSRMSCA